MLDNLPFTIKSDDLSGGAPFRIFGALDYRNGQSKLLRLTAYLDARTPRWVDFLSQFDGMPDLIVWDAHDGMLTGIRQVWGGRYARQMSVAVSRWLLARDRRQLQDELLDPVVARVPADLDEPALLEHADWEAGGEAGCC